MSTRVLFSNPDKKNITEQDLINGYNLYKNHIPDL